MRLIYPILFILLSIATFIFGVNRFYKDVSSLRSDIAVYNLALSNSTDLKKKEDSLLSSFNQIKQEDMSRLDSFLPNSVNNIQFILEMERIASTHGMTIKDIKFDTDKKTTAVNPNLIVSEANNDNKPYGVFPIEFKTQGKYNDFVLFLKDLESNLRLVDIKSIYFVVPTYDENTGKTTGGANPDIYEYSLNVETYWLK